MANLDRPASSLSTRSDDSVLQRRNSSPDVVCPEPARLTQPWKAALQVERDSGTNPLLSWTPNRADFGEKPWLKIDWSKNDSAGSGGVRSRSPDQMCGYAVGNLKLE